jgi:hypothetical protein
MLFALVYWLLRRLIGLTAGSVGPGTTTSRSSSFAISLLRSAPGEPPSPPPARSAAHGGAQQNASPPAMVGVP